MKRETFSEAIEGATQVNENTFVREVPAGYRIYTNMGSETAYTSVIVSHKQVEAIKLFTV